jgi:hypothetical protein
VSDVLVLCLCLCVFQVFCLFVHGGLCFCVAISVYLGHRIGRLLGDSCGVISRHFGFFGTQSR